MATKRKLHRLNRPPNLPAGSIDGQTGKVLEKYVSELAEWINLTNVALRNGHAGADMRHMDQLLETANSFNDFFKTTGQLNNLDDQAQEVAAKLALSFAQVVISSHCTVIDAAWKQLEGASLGGKSDSHDMDKLSPEERRRRVIVMSKDPGNTRKDIAEVTGISTRRVSQIRKEEKNKQTRLSQSPINL